MAPLMARDARAPRARRQWRATSGACLSWAISAPVVALRRQQHREPAGDPRRAVPLPGARPTPGLSSSRAHPYLFAHASPISLLGRVTRPAEQLSQQGAYPLTEINPAEAGTPGTRPWRGTGRGARKASTVSALRPTRPVPFWPWGPHDQYRFGLVGHTTSTVLALGATRTNLAALCHPGPKAFWA